MTPLKILVLKAFRVVVEVLGDDLPFKHPTSPISFLVTNLVFAGCKRLTSSNT